MHRERSGLASFRRTTPNKRPWFPEWTHSNSIQGLGWRWQSNEVPTNDWSGLPWVELTCGYKIAVGWNFIVQISKNLNNNSAGTIKIFANQKIQRLNEEPPPPCDPALGWLLYVGLAWFVVAGFIRSSWNWISLRWNDNCSITVVIALFVNSKGY